MNHEFTKAYVLNGETWTQRAYHGPVTSPDGKRRISPSVGQNGVRWHIAVLTGCGWIDPEPFGSYETPELAEQALRRYAT